jgi:hypothetical protein
MPSYRPQGAALQLLLTRQDTQLLSYPLETEAEIVRVFCGCRRCDIHFRFARVLNQEVLLYGCMKFKAF